MVKLDFHGKEERRWTGPRLRTGAIIGHATTSSAKIWVRCRYEGTYHLVLCLAELTSEELEIGNMKADEYVTKLGSKVAYHKARKFSNRTDRTNVFNVRNLSAETRYSYYVFSANTNLH